MVSKKRYGFPSAALRAVLDNNCWWVKFSIQIEHPKA
jgi:hypothetical protein